MKNKVNRTLEKLLKILYHVKMNDQCYSNQLHSKFKVFERRSSTLQGTAQDRVVLRFKVNTFIETP